MAERVEIKVKVPIELDTKAAEEAARGIPNKVKQAAQQSPAPPPSDPATQQSIKKEIDLQGRVQEKLREQIGTQFSFIKNKKEINALYKEELAHVRTMEEDFARLKRSRHGLTEAEMKARERDVREARHFVNRLRDTIAVETARERLGIPASVEPAMERSGRGAFDMTLQQAANGGLVGAGVGLASRAIMAHPVLAALAIGGLTANWALNKTDEMARPSEDLDIAFTNVGRRSGMGRVVRRLFQKPSGETDEDLFRLGFTGPAMARMAEAFGMPAGGMTFRNAIRSQAEFARAFGFGENPEMISALGRRATQLGAAEPDQQGQFWRSMTVAVERGMKQGVDASETMRSIMGLSEKAASHLGVISQSYVAGLEAIQATLSEGGTRFFKGERGAQQVGSLLDAFQRPRGIAQERFVQNAIMGHFGGRIPTAEELGLPAGQAEAFDQMPDIHKLQAIQQMLPQILATGGPAAKGLLGGLGRMAARSAGPGGESVMLQALTGMEPGAMLALSESLSKSIRSRHGEEKARELDGRPLSMLAELMEKGIPEDVIAMMRGKTPDASTTKIEDLRAAQAQISEIFSKSVSDASLELRKLAESAKLAAERLGVSVARGEQEIISDDQLTLLRHMLLSNPINVIRQFMSGAAQ